MSDERPEKPLPEKADVDGAAPRNTAPDGVKPREAAPDEVMPRKADLSKEPAAGSTPASDPRPALRASDADRERVVERLRDAVAEGRLDMDEFEERLEAAYTSRTYAELEPLTRDLPAVAAAYPPADRPAPGTGTSWPARIGGAGTSSGAVAIMSGFQRKGHWTVPGRFTAVAFWGGGEIDLREANFAEREVEITCVAIMGGIEIVVPPGVEVDVRGIGIMGAFDQRDSPSPADPGAPRVVITGLAFWGGVEIKVKARKGLGGGKARKEL
ncbi:DUF1707 domain-containing protein [Streptomyces sp. NPDC090022]|uniref:DUF1707 SHOCT-like domain-containing protein n=1 Tax=Streptomyces sp. NPDC090022 TaxID=3365920 RepID=UPI0037FC692D